MPAKYYEYTTYPGRQVEVTVAPRYYPHYFCDGVQSITVTHNSDKFEHGQYTFESDVLVEGNYKNTSGTISFKDFGNSGYVLRGMMGMNPATSYLSDPTHVLPVDLCINILSQDRQRVLRSSWFVDFIPSYNGTESLADIPTLDISYVATRKIDFEGYQIIHQEWIDTKEGDQDFRLYYPAMVDVADTYVKRMGQMTHELSPIRYTLRVIVGGEVLKDPSQAEVTTTASGSDVYSVLHLHTPIGTPGTPVIMFWLADGRYLINRTGLTIAPVMSDIVPRGDWTIGGTGWDGTLEVYFSEALKNVESLCLNSNNEFANFVLTATELDNMGNIITQGSAHPYDIGGANNGQPAQFAPPGTLISRNKLLLNFVGSTGFSSLPSPIPVIPGNTLIWNLQYKACGGVLPLMGEETDAITPVHTLNIRTSIM